MKSAAIAVVLGSLAATAAQAADSGTRLLAAQTPGGAVRVLVVITDGAWPAGIRLEDESGAVLVPRIAADSDAARAVDGASQVALGALARLPQQSGANARSLGAVLALRLVSDWQFARAAGAATELPSGSHPRSVRARALAADGSAGAVLATATVQTDNGPPAPTQLRAVAGATGIVLHWQLAPKADAIPVYAYSVERGDASSREPLMLHPQLLTRDRSGAANPFTDHAPPVDLTVTYSVALVDSLGVAGSRADVSVFSPDLEAGAPPAHQAAKAGRGLITLTWDLTPNARTGGFSVERSQLVDGPYEILTPEGLDPKTARFDDQHVARGAGYYYRVRAVSTNGTLGPAPDPVREVALGSAAPAAPGDVRAEVGATQIQLSWSPVAGAIAGYIVERRASSAAPRWTRLNSRLVPDTQLTDPVGPSAGGSFEYRVTAVASDEAIGSPSAVLTVKLVDSESPPAPIVLAASGADGRAELRFAASEPAARTVQVALVRADAPTEDGLVVGAPVPVAAGVIRDDWVRAGESYWYRLVAFDAAGRRSAESDAFRVRVAAVKLPVPKAPTVAYAESPSPSATVSFDAPPPKVRVIVQAERDAGVWASIAGPMDGTSAVDRNPSGPHARYRIVYVAEEGGPGVPSPAAAAR